MANCSYIFTSFNKVITLTPTERKFLRTARKAITTKIKNYFSENEHCPNVDFKIQGSFSMGTIIRPISGEFDIDIGVYLRGYTNYQSSWPSAQTASQWLIKALTNHTSTAPINKKTCVRIVYRPISANEKISYHVDLPIYCEYTDLVGDKYTKIGITGDNLWKKSDPVGFTIWFSQQCKKNTSDPDQLVRLIKYFKAWKDYQQGETKFPSGMALTILVAKNFVPDQRDDLSFSRSITAAWNEVFVGFWPLFGIYEINSPVQPFNNVVEKLRESEVKIFKERFEELVDAGKKAIESSNQEEAIEIWKRLFGKRLPV